MNSFLRTSLKTLHIPSAVQAWKRFYTGASRAHVIQRAQKPSPFMKRKRSNNTICIFLTGILMVAFYAEASPPISLPGPISQPEAAPVTPSFIPSITPAPMPAMPSAPEQVQPSAVPPPAPVQLTEPGVGGEADKQDTVAAATASVYTSSFNLPTWKGSLMFSAEDLQTLESYLKTLNNPQIVEVADEQGQIAVVPAPAPAPVTTIFYLSSLIYISENNWNVWVNKIRYSAGIEPVQGIRGLHVDHVSADKAYFTWTTAVLDTIVPGWERKFSVNKEGGFTAHGNKGITVSKDKTMISFSLYPYQHFSLSDMAVYEGSGGS